MYAPDVSIYALHVIAWAYLHSITPSIKQPARLRCPEKIHTFLDGHDPSELENRLYICCFEVNIFDSFPHILSRRICLTDFEIRESRSAVQALFQYLPTIIGNFGPLSLEHLFPLYCCASGPNPYGTNLQANTLQASTTQICHKRDDMTENPLTT